MHSKICGSLPPLPKSGQCARWSGLHGCLSGLIFARTAEQYAAPVVVMTTDMSECYRLQTEIAFFLDPRLDIPLLHYPDWETLPFDNFSPHQDIVSDRLQTLYQLQTLPRWLLVSPITAALVRTPPSEHVIAAGLQFKVGQRISLSTISDRLVEAGYVRVEQVMEYGEFALRGSLLDVFATGSKAPVRIDLFDDEIESIRNFDPDTQCTTRSTDQIRLLPAHECPLNPAAIAHFRAAWRSRFEGDPSRCQIYQDVSHGIATPGIEYYLPLFFPHCSSLLEQLPPNALIIFTDGAETAAAAFLREVKERYDIYRHDPERPILMPSEIFCSVDTIFRLAKPHPRIQISNHDTTTEGTIPPDAAGCPTDALSQDVKAVAALEPPSTTQLLDTLALEIPLRAIPMADHPYETLQRFLAGYDGRVLFLAESPGRHEIMLGTLRDHGIDVKAVADWHSFVTSTHRLGITTVMLERGGQLLQPAITIITEPQLFGKSIAQQRQRRHSKRDLETVVRDLSELHIGAPVVHERHGIGRYQGLQTLNTSDGVTAEFLCLHYAGDDKLYVPVLSMELVSRYTGMDPESAPLHTLGGAQWERACRRAAQKAHDVAAELISVQAQRSAHNGHSHTVANDALATFESTFPFVETPDQTTCIQAVYADLASTKSMDRLICGDVGFGKTEIAMRAAFVVAYSGKQIAVLVPTTLLAQQHFQTFNDRFANWPLRIDHLSRFRMPKERKEILQDLANGKLDVIIGTHHLLQNSVRFHNLGLIIIDEEHRFGVRQKERLKHLRTQSDILTLTATPIPRTLNMAVSGLRDLSLVTTPPADRLSIQTLLREWDDGTIREGMQRELRRGGQVFFVHNKVQDIDEFADHVQQLVPDAKVRVAHGQMHARDLEHTMLDFYHRRFQVLVCTTIIETGIDIPNVNTIFIDRADHYGMAQLYQLRGRVGRSHHRAYAYLLVPPKRVMTPSARRRLEAIASLECLGVGFALATHDLEIRGAGELLGEGQSGQINAIGYSMYTRLLERATKSLKKGEHIPLNRPLTDGPEIDLHVSALIPENYLGDVNARLVLYRRLSNAADDASLEDLQVEMIDRFGPLPEELNNLIHIKRLKQKARRLGICEIKAHPTGVRLKFAADTTIATERVIRVIQSNPQRYRLEGPDKLRIDAELPDAKTRIATIESFMNQLTGAQTKTATR